MDIPLRVLLVEDCEDDALLILRELRRGGYDPIHERVETPEQLHAAIASPASWDAVIADYTMPGFDGLMPLEAVRSSGLDIPFIIVSGTIGQEIAVEAMRQGAHDYIMKVDLTRLVPALERELREARVRDERERIMAQVRHQAHHDPITQLPNRMLFLDRLRQAIWTASLHHTPVTLTHIDLDHFAVINESLGHLQGDLVLSELGSRIRAGFPEVTTVARLGNDEFAIIQPGVTPDQASDAIPHLLDDLLRPVALQSGSVSVGVSAGIAGFPEHADDAEALIHHAGFALRTAKAGPSGASVYNPIQARDRLTEITLISDLRTMLNSDPSQLFVVFQPKVEVSSGKPRSVEALVRWQHPEHGLLQPDAFIPIAESEGIIGRLTALVLQQTFAAAPDWNWNGMQPHVSVNLSAWDLEDPELAAMITRQLTASNLDASVLDVEITETAMLRAPLVALRSLHELHDMGISVSVDDFGMGYSSFAYLRELPITSIKVDKAFVAGMVGNATDAAIVRSIIDLGHNLGLNVIAEGVEHSDAWEMLRTMQCDLAQGYLIARPMPPNELASWIRSWNGEPLPDS